MPFLSTQDSVPGKGGGVILVIAGYTEGLLLKKGAPSQCVQSQKYDCSLRISKSRRNHERTSYPIKSKY